MKKYMAYNHNDTPLMKEPGAKSEADKEANEYVCATGNEAYVAEIEEQYPWRSAMMWSVVASMKLGIINDINAGIIPPTVKSFSELHNYVDANEYGGFCIDTFADELIELFGGRDELIELFGGRDELIELFGGRDENEGLPDDYVAFMNEAQNIIDAWIKKANETIEKPGPKLVIASGTL